MIAAADPAAPEHGERGLRARVALSLGPIVLLGAAFGGWAANATLSGAIVAPGHVVVDSSVKKVQHPTGGVVGRLLVKNGDRVHAGDVLVRLDDTVTRANLAVIMSQTTELTGRLARLAAERDGASTIRLPDGFERVDAAAVTSMGGVSQIAPGETVMAIVPDDDRRAIEVRLAPADIDQVTLGQPAVIRFAALNHARPRS